MSQTIPNGTTTKLVSRNRLRRQIVSTRRTERRDTCDVPRSFPPSVQGYQKIGNAEFLLPGWAVRVRPPGARCACLSRPQHTGHLIGKFKPKRRAKPGDTAPGLSRSSRRDLSALASDFSTDVSARILSSIPAGHLAPAMAPAAEAARDAPQVGLQPKARQRTSSGPHCCMASFLTAERC